jgi:hypothetical protein
MHCLRNGGGAWVYDVAADEAALVMLGWKEKMG